MRCLTNPRVVVAHKTWRAVPRKKDKTITKHLRLRRRRVELGRVIFTFDLPKSRRIFFGIARFDVMLLLFLLLYLMFVGFLHHLCHLSGFALHVTLWSGKTFVGFPFFGRPKNHSSATCQIESATDPGSTYVCVCVLVYIRLLDCPILHNSPRLWMAHRVPSKKGSLRRWFTLVSCGWRYAQVWSQARLERIFIEFCSVGALEAERRRGTHTDCERG